MIAADDYWRFQLARSHHFIKCQAGQMPLAKPQPADTRRKPLEGDALARHLKPAVDTLVLGEKLLDLFVGLVDVVRVSRERHPAKWTFAFAEERPDVRRHESWKVERILDFLLERDLADIIAVVDYRHAHLVEVQHRLHM